MPCNGVAGHCFQTFASATTLRFDYNSILNWFVIINSKCLDRVRLCFTKIGISESFWAIEVVWRAQMCFAITSWLLRYLNVVKSCFILGITTGETEFFWPPIFFVFDCGNLPRTERWYRNKLCWQRNKTTDLPQWTTQNWKLTLPCIIKVFSPTSLYFVKSIGIHEINFVLFDRINLHKHRYRFLQLSDFHLSCKSFILVAAKKIEFVFDL